MRFYSISAISFNFIQFHSHELYINIELKSSVPDVGKYKTAPCFTVPFFPSYPVSECKRQSIMEFSENDQRIVCHLIEALHLNKICFAREVLG